MPHFTDLKIALSLAIKQYEMLYTRKLIPLYRVEDISDLKILIYFQDTDSDYWRKQLEKRLRTMKTGLILWGVELIPTGRSRLKSYVQGVLKNPNYSPYSLLSTSYKENLSELSKLKETCEAVQINTGSTPLLTYIEVKKERDQLQQEVKDLKIRNKKLYAKNIKLLHAQRSTQSGENSSQAHNHHHSNQS